ncbi:MAG: hypothetical protein ACLQLG_14285 [Thermoguttaceae bacterium]
MAIIPGKNPMALLAYYLGVFSLIPCLGLVLGLPAVLLGILGISAANRNPEIQGKGHAITGLVLGLLTSILWLGLITLVVLDVRRSAQMLRW